MFRKRLAWNGACHENLHDHLTHYFLYKEEPIKRVIAKIIKGNKKQLNSYI